MCTRAAVIVLIYPNHSSFLSINLSQNPLLPETVSYLSCIMAIANWLQNDTVDQFNDVHALSIVRKKILARAWVCAVDICGAGQVKRQTNRNWNARTHKVDTVFSDSAAKWLLALKSTRCALAKKKKKFQFVPLNGSPHKWYFIASVIYTYLLFRGSYYMRLFIYFIKRNGVHKQ